MIKDNKKIDIIMETDIMRKYFTCYYKQYFKHNLRFTDNTNIYVYCNNSELFDIIKRNNPSYLDYDAFTYDFNFIFVNKIEDNFLMCEGNNGINDDEFLLFEFETEEEEEAFHFKLKYC